MEANDTHQEKELLEQKLKRLRKKMVQQIEKKRFLGLDHQVRRVQRQYQLLERI